MGQGGQNQVVPATGSQESTQVKQVLRVVLQPEHAVGLETEIDDLSDGALHGPRTDRQAAVLERLVAHALGVPGKVIPLRRQGGRETADAQFVDDSDDLLDASATQHALVVLEEAATGAGRPVDAQVGSRPEVFYGVVVVDDGDEPRRLDGDGRDELIDAVPDPTRSITDEDQRSRLMSTLQPQVADQQSEDGVGIAQRCVVQRADLTFHPTASIGDIDGENLGLPPRSIETAVMGLAPATPPFARLPDSQAPPIDGDDNALIAQGSGNRCGRRFRELRSS